MKHKDLEVYVGLTEGGCEDVGHLNLYNYTLLKDERLFELEAAEKERDALHTALEKIADWDSAWGPYPETNEAWRAMAIVTAREAVPRPGEKK